MGKLTDRYENKNLVDLAKKQYEKEKGEYDSGIRLEENLENAIQ